MSREKHINNSNIYFAKRQVHQKGKKACDKGKGKGNVDLYGA